MVYPGKRAPAHRYMMEAICFIVKGRGASTIVEGEQFAMEEEDLITTPNWSWHDHVNAADQPIIWLDGANRPMIHYFQVIFAEPYSIPRQAVVRPVGWSGPCYGVVRPRETVPSGKGFRPPYRYPWRETERALETRSEDPGDPFDGVPLRFVDPLWSRHYHENSHPLEGSGQEAHLSVDLFPLSYLFTRQSCH
jgi:gentisate 1,2-dioxygenase